MGILLLWLRQPTTVAGISALFGTLLGVFTHQIGWGQALPLLAGAATSIILPDNSGAKAAAESVARGLLAPTTGKGAAS
jgi:hypothetical protein